ncbi:MAG TPA: hypothetical protein VE177_00650, partial [Candidatus Binatus sp.]|nr:hypothetical protein [Candidatus Binatus sp.]
MLGRSCGLVAILLAVFLLTSAGPTGFAPEGSSNGEKNPLPIHNGPLSGSTLQPAGRAFWFQVGAIGDASSSKNYGASVMIRTAYDQASNDAHSYWVGGYLSTGAFIQVGYLTTVSTSGSTYCCSWFYEYFPSTNSNCCNPVIGPEFSAGPIGSWHTYKMDSNLDGTWSFYMDDKLLTLPRQANATGTTPSLGAIDSGNDSPAALAEVADALNDRDTLGPGEFRNLTYRASTTPSDYQLVPRGLGFKDYGQPSSRALANPYNSVEIHGVDNNLLAGSHLPLLPSPATSAVFWPNTVMGTSTQLLFHDTSGGTFVPDWISLVDSSNPSSQVFYTAYTSMALDPGAWLLQTTMWHVTNVTD